MSLQKLSNLLPKNSQQLQSSAQIEGAQVCKLWNDYAQQYFLDMINQNHEAINFRDGILTISVASLHIKSELKTQQAKIISRINHSFSSPIVKLVRYREG